MATRRPRRIERPSESPPWPFTEATVVIEFKRQEYRPLDYEWSREMALNLNVGDIITDVKLPPPDFKPPTPLYRRPENGWYHGQLREKQGVFNSRYVQFRYSPIPLNVEHILSAVEYVNLEPLCDCVYLPDSKKHHEHESVARRVLVEYWLLNDPAPSWRKLLQRLDWAYYVHVDMTCAAAADAIRHVAEPIQDTTFTLTNVMSTLETVQQWEDLARQFGIPWIKYRRKDGDNIMNYYITTSPGASWSALAGALYYRGEQRGLTKVTRYFQRQPEPTLTIANLRTELEQVELMNLGHILESRRRGTKEVIIEEFIRNHPAPSWRLIADRLYMCKYHAAVQSVKRKYLKVESRQLFNEAMKNGKVRSFNTVALLVGSAGSGKTCSKHVILNEQPPEVRVSTAVAERPVKVVKVLTINGLEWHRLTSMQQKEILARVMASRGKTKVDLAVPQLPTGSNNPELTKKPDSKSPSVPLESSSSPKTETTQTSTTRSHTTTSTQRSGEESLEVLTESPTTEEDFVALIDNSSGSEPIMEVNLIHLVDSGGQPQFHEVLPAFLRRRSAYIFVVNLSEKLDTRPQIEYYDHRGKLICKACPATHTNLQILMHCIRTLQSHKFGGKAPHIFIFGTHRDLEYKCSETREAKNRKIAEMLLPKFEDEVVYYNVPKKELIFPLNAKLPEKEDWKTAEVIRKLIMDKCSPQPDDTPLRWYGLEIALQEMAESLKRGVMSKEECFTVALRFHFDSDSFEAALQHLDGLNIIFYYPNTIPDVVFTDPQVLLDKVTELVKFSYELQNENADSAVMAGGGEYQKFQENALVTSDFLASDKFSKHYVPNLFTPLDLVKLFRALLIFADFSDTEYFMPCLLRIISSEEVAKHRLSFTAATVPLVLYFPHGGPLLGVFCCLVVFLLSTENCFPYPWKLHVNDSLGTPMCLHRNCVKFRIPDYVGTITLIDAFSFFEVHVSSPDNLCPFVHHAVFIGLKRAAANLGYNNNVAEVAFLCSCSSEDLHPATVSKGQKHWICTQHPEKYGNIDEKQQMWLTASADPPKITQQPNDQSVITGAKVTFQVEATGDNLHFQWQKNQSDLGDGDRCCGTHTNRLRIIEVEMSDRGRYRCLVKNLVAKELSDEAFLTVKTPTPTPGVLQPTGQLPYSVGSQYPTSQHLYSRSGWSHQTLDPLQHPPQGFPQDVSNLGLLPPKPESKDLMHLQIHDWNRLGLALKLNPYDLNIIEKDYQGDTRRQTLKMFEHWLKTQPNASYEQLIKALHEVRDETVASSLSMKYGYAQKSHQQYPSYPPAVPTDWPMYPQHGYPQHGYPHHGYPHHGYPHRGYPYHVYPHHGYPPPGSQYLPQPGTYGQPTPYQLRPAHVGIPPQQYTPGPPMPEPSNQADNEQPQTQ